MDDQRITPEQLDEVLQKEFQVLRQRICDAMNEAKAGRIIADSEEPVRDAHAVFRQQAYQTDYPHFCEQGYDCASGPTESQCGTLTHRVKGAGMRWDADNVESMMVLAALDHSQQWKAYWKLQRAA